ncbi:molybdenum cofactor-independent xanthine hydroxylase subunit HpxD [Erwinia pyrifoliae]|uniref:molybdenum cofactor-independent xanthine hydroxylase subunit HpxD n=1 Tax=Erwinia pyrifoliae TaxID=79967 RepID=UPI0001961493|nr:molybdenum cofactor-independent xanthine hydroxylase subunit HpxD [Erwinia pyrifoliae]AUX71159.1 aromatic ring-hydroxylating dioxygenase subunit alpha [Erwinia pyrifoliae]MCA8875129.1 molybdenum cofactor-independent xanthine hydroxylase subunit HpxD [Erwinia pyrifoliae]UXK12214.1 molybdenum cofactor-independent xanthine hydroxylase subunit HpxD [Erwinia pyrifoliae]CAX57326.1 vanillate O-demethylase oxygenase subunit [Erwinia pyrifoliae Ep1/96]
MKAKITPPPHCTFEPDDWERLARHWHPVTLAADIGQAPVKAVLLDEPLVIYRVDGQVVVARDVCPHRGVPLTLGFHDQAGIICPYHGLRFGEGGRCNRIPSSPGQAIPAKLHLLTYASEERYGLIWVCLAAEEGSVPPLPVMPHWEDAGFQQIVCPHFDVAGFAGRQVEGFLDVAHFAWIHTETFANPENQAVPPYSPIETSYGFSVDYWSSVSNYSADSDRQAPEGFRWLRHFEMHLPFTATLTIHFPQQERLVIMNAASPVSARKTRLFAPITRNFDLHIPVEEVHAFNHRVFEEDRLMVETQRPERLPLDLTLEAHIPADRSSIAYRRGLKKQGFGDFFLV